ncbi:MAG: DUF3488 and transglutaminase-like domain-containing protein [Chloroflexota bacterium]|nr:DUF3488 and transglutaminase-like domain-containing protein [Chloroflexota bacterium]
MQATRSRRPQRFAVPGAWMSGFLLLVLLLNLTMSLKAAQWTDGLGILSPVVLGGFLLGTAISYSRWRGIFPVFYSLIVGTVWVLIWVGRAPQIPGELVGPERIAFIGASLWSWLLLLFSDQPARSNLVFILELGFLLWWIGYLSAWALFREGKVWRAIIPIGLIMLVNLYFGPSTLGFYLAIFVVAALLLAVRNHLAEREAGWRYERVRYASDIQFDFLRDGLIFALMVLAIGLLTPNAAGSGTLSSSLEPLREPWREVQEEWGRLFSSLNYQGAEGRPAFGDTLTLSGPRDLGDTVIMDVRSNAGRYWRAATFDTFTGRRWINSNTFAQYVDNGSHVQTPEYQARREITQTVTTHYPAGNVLFGAPQPVRISLKAEASLGIIEEASGDEELPLAEIAMLRRRGADLRPGESYLVVSQISDANIEDLQEAGSDYPDWLMGRYLDTPATMSSRVGELAAQVTASAETPFEKVLALEQYLRGFTYDDSIPAPPSGVDAVDYFLFDVQAGYCDYYASSLAMMARTLGIPARVVAGYNQGEYIPEVEAFRVREYNGHSWPEVFFPGYGWIEFEPTASEVEIVRTHRPPEMPLDESQSDVNPLEEEEDRFGEDPALGEGGPPPADPGAGSISGGSWIAGIGGMLLLVALAAFVLLRPSSSRNRRARLDSQFAVKLYGRLMQWARRLRLPILPSQTPNEHAAVLANAVPEGQDAITSITDIYVQEQYSPFTPDERDADSAFELWKGLQPLMRRAWLRTRFSAITGLGKQRGKSE